MSAARSFKALVIIITWFDLEIIKYDAVNTFINAPLNKVIYIRISPRYYEKRKVLFLYKTLYNLKKILVL